MIWGVGACVAMVAVTWLVYGIRQIGAVSSGSQIGQRVGSALLLIDLQTVFWDSGVYSEAEKSKAKAAVLAQVDAAKAEGTPIIALRQEWSLPATRLVARLFMKGHALQGSPGTELAAGFAGLADYECIKRVQDGFETGALDLLLGKLDVGHLAITGLDMNYCVAKTALAARNRGYEVEVIELATLAAQPDATPKTRAALTSQGVTLR